jgi:hypothetical protein
MTDLLDILVLVSVSVGIATITVAVVRFCAEISRQYLGKFLG